jgi:hypothetical protein
VKLISKWNGGRIFVRVFGPNDTIYIFGRWETTLGFGESVDFNLPEGRLQLEIKKDGLFGPFIVRPGQIWSNTDVRLLNDKGELVQPDANDTTTDVATELDVTIKYVLLGAEKTEHEHLQRVLHLSGPAAQRRVNVDDFTIVRDATTKIEALHGAFGPATGEMSLSAKASVSLAGLVLGSQFVGLTTSAASSGSRFSDTGTAYDAATRKFKLVGGGLVAGVEFFVTVEGACSSPLS